MKHGQLYCIHAWTNVGNTCLWDIPPSSQKSQCPMLCKKRVRMSTRRQKPHSQKNTHTHVCISLYIYIYMYTQHICIHTHIWIHMYIHIHYLLNCASHIVSRKLERLAWYITCWHVQGLTLADSHNWLTVSSDPFLEPVLGIHVFIELGGMHTGFL